MIDRHSARGGTLAAILVAGIVAAILEIIPALIVQPRLGVPPERMFQSIAGGLLGRDTYQGGLGTAGLGVFLHVFISVVAAAIYIWAAQRWSVLLRRPVLCGLAFGLASWIVMSQIVVPLSAAAFPPATKPAMIAVSIGVHMLLFGLPIALVARRMLGRRSL